MYVYINIIIKQRAVHDVINVRAVTQIAFLNRRKMCVYCKGAEKSKWNFDVDDMDFHRKYTMANSSGNIYQKEKNNTNNK